MVLSLQPLHPEKVQRLADEVGFDEAWLKKPVKAKAAQPKPLALTDGQPLALADGQPPPALQWHAPMVLTGDHGELPGAPSKAPPAMPNPAQPNLLIDGHPAAIAAQATPPGVTPAQPKLAGATPAQSSVRNVLQQLAAAPPPDAARDRIAANREAALARRRMRQAQDTIDLVWFGNGHHQLQCVLYIYI